MKTNLTFTLAEKQWRNLRRLARNRQQSLSALIRLATKQWILSKGFNKPSKPQIVCPPGKSSHDDASEKSMHP